MNLLINAVQAIENRGVIKIKTFRSHNFVVIQISDTGKGIPKENQSKIFDAFFTTKESGKGTGLGLSISLKIIQEHNGTIDVESKSGEGTTFTIRLPLKKLVQIIEHKVLIVDDEEDFRDVLKKSIQLYDPSFTVKTAKDGFEAGELINSLKPNLVILDIKMPGLNGFEVCRKIMSSELKDKAKVIMITGFEDIDAKEKSIKAGAFEFMKKPINIKKLYNVLDKIFK